MTVDLEDAHGETDNVSLEEKVETTQQDYSPTLGEITKEMAYGLARPVASAATYTAKAITSATKNMSCGSVFVGGLTLMPIAVLHTIPTSWRIAKENKDPTPLLDRVIDYSLDNLSDTALNILAVPAYIGTLFAGMGTITAYVYLAVTDNPEYLLIPAATNILSGTYELFRKGALNAKQRLVDQHEATHSLPDEL